MNEVSKTSIFANNFWPPPTELGMNTHFVVKNGKTFSTYEIHPLMYLTKVMHFGFIL